MRFRDCNITVADSENAPKELERFIEFYEKHRHANNRGRDPADLLRSVEEKRVHYVFDAKNNDILGIGVCFRRNGGTIAELGGARVVHGGLELHKILLCTRIISEYAFGWPTRCAYAIANETNNRAITNMREIGLIDWKSKDAARAIDDGIPAGKVAFRCERPAIGRAVRYIERLLGEEIRLLNGLPFALLPADLNGKQIRLRFDVPAISERKIWDEIRRTRF